MTAYKWVSLECDAIGCMRRFDSSKNHIPAARLEANREGWGVGYQSHNPEPLPKLQVRDYCPKHAGRTS